MIGLVIVLLAAAQRLAVPALDDAGQLVGQLGDEMLPVPGDLGLGENLLLHLARNMGPGRHHARTQAAHQTFVFRWILENFFFHDRHANGSLLQWG